MTQTMRHAKSNVMMGLSLLLLAAGGTLRAQVNPTTVKNQAQNGVNQAQQTQPSTKGQAQGQQQTKQPTQTAPKNQAQSQTKTSQQTSTKQANPPVKTPPATGTKPPAANTAKPPAPKPPVPSGQQPPKPPATKTPAQDQKKAPIKTAPPPKTAPKTGQANHPVPTGPPAKQAPPKAAAKTPAKKPETTTPTAETRPAPPPVRRDPFVTLIGKHQGGPESQPVKLPPGKAGLQVNTLVLQGILSSPGGMIAVVANPQRSVYFLHVGDELFDGRVERIEIDGVTFHEVGKDAFGKPLERQVTRKLNPSLGEQP